MDKQKSNEVNAPTSINDFNPLRNKLSPQQFDASVKFYEADHDLMATDRNEIADDLKSIVFKTAFVGYGSAVAGFSLPTLYNKLQVSNVPKNTRPLIYKPFLSFMIGLSTLMIMNQQAAKFNFNKQINFLQDSSKSRQLNVWKAMDYHQAALFYLYYRKTSENPSMVIPDPRTFTEKTMHEVHYNPTGDSRGHTTKSESNQQYPAPHWDQIRRQNGFVTAETGIDKQETISTSSEQNSTGTPVPETTKPTSAWDAIRQKK